MFQVINYSKLSIKKFLCLLFKVQSHDILYKLTIANDNPLIVLTESKHN